MPTCQRLLLPHVPDGDSLPRAAGQDAVCGGVELQHIHRVPPGPQGQPRVAGHVLAALGQAPHLHLQPQGEGGQSPGRVAGLGWVPAALDLGLLLFQASVPEDAGLITARWDQSCGHPRWERADLSMTSSAPYPPTWGHPTLLPKAGTLLPRLLLPSLRLHLPQALHQIPGMRLGDTGCSLGTL